MFKKAIEILYDQDLLPVNRDNAANYITLVGVWMSRFSLYVFFGALAWFLYAGEVSQWARGVAIALTSFAAVMDGIDGYVARKFKCVSDFGKIFDPHHDKIQYQCKTLGLITDSFFALLATGNYWFLLFAIPVKYFTGERDETVGFHRTWAATVSDQIQVSARQSGKWRTRVCFTALPILHLVIYPFAHVPSFIVLALLCIAVTNWSLHDYVTGYRDAIRSAKKASVN
ncbi:MAG: CDP-alcohol phosphatidyltransferase family protein [Patescibacteria group bacterium]